MFPRKQPFRAFSAWLVICLFAAVMPLQTVHAAGVLYIIPNGTGNCSDLDHACDLQTTLTGAIFGGFTLTTNGVSGASIISVSGSDNIYTETVSTGNGLGTIHLDVPDNATITDLAGNLLAGLPFTGGQFYIISEMWDIFLPLVIR